MKNILNEIVSLLRLNTGRTNLKVAILCLIAATLFWFFNSLNKDYTANVRYPISFLYDSDNFTSIDELPDEVLLNMTGVGWNLLRKSLGYRTAPILIRLESPDNISGIPGSSLPSAITDQVTDLQLNYVLTDTLYVNLDRKVTKYMKVGINAQSISLEDNFVLGEGIQIRPDSIELTGPLSMINTFGDTVFVSLTDQSLDETFEDDLEIILPRTDLFTRNPPVVSVVVPVESVQKIDLTLPLELRNWPRNIELSDSLISLSVWVRESRSSDIKAEDFNALVDFMTIDFSDSTISPQLSRSPDYLERTVLDSTRLKVIFR